MANAFQKTRFHGSTPPREAKPTRTTWREAKPTRHPYPHHGRVAKPICLSPAPCIAKRDFHPSRSRWARNPRPRQDKAEASATTPQSGPCNARRSQSTAQPHLHHRARRSRSDHSRAANPRFPSPTERGEGEASPPAPPGARRSQSAASTHTTGARRSRSDTPARRSRCDTPQREAEAPSPTRSGARMARRGLPPPLLTPPARGGAEATPPPSEAKPKRHPREAEPMRHPATRSRSAQSRPVRCACGKAWASAAYGFGRQADPHPRKVRPIHPAPARSGARIARRGLPPPTGFW